MNPYHVLQSPLTTEKSSSLAQQKKYVVIVNPAATKVDVRQAVEKLYRVKVASVRSLRTPSKTRLVGRGRLISKRPEQKKVIIALQKGEKPLDFIKTKKTK